MYFVLLALLAGCATAASGDDTMDGDLTGPPGTEMGQGGAGDLGRDLAQPPPGSDLATGPDLVTGPGPSYAYPRINEVAPDAGGVALDEYVEIIGADRDIGMKGWTLHYQTAGGSASLLATFGDVTLPAGSYYLVAASGSRFAGMADLTYAGGASGRIARAGAGLALLNPGGMRVDSMGYGSATGSFVQGRAAPGPDISSASRIPDGVDTHRNQDDFQVAALTPRMKNHL